MPVASKVPFFKHLSCRTAAGPAAGVVLYESYKPMDCDDAGCYLDRQNNRRMNGVSAWPETSPRATRICKRAVKKPAARRGIEFPLLGRGSHDLRETAAVARASPISTTTSTSTTAWATAPRSSATRTRAWMRPRAQGMEVGRRVRAVDGARALGGGADLQDGAGGRTGALLEFRHRSGDGGLAPRARLYRQGRLRDSRGQLSRPVRRGDVVHADGQMVAGRATPRSSPTARACRSARAAWRISSRRTTRISSRMCSSATPRASPAC